MHRIRSLLFAVLMLLALGSFAASAASAQPLSTSVLLLPGAIFPVEFSSLPSDSPNNGILTELQNAAGVLEGEGFLLKGSITSETGGLYEVLFLKVKEKTSTSPCSTAGDASGEVLVPRGDFHFVHDETEATGTGTLFEVPEFVITCGTLRVKIKGAALGLLENVPSREDILALILGHLHCNGRTTGEPEDTKYWTSLLSSQLTPLLLAEFGTGFRKACEEIKSKIHIDFSKMLEVMNP